MNWKHVSKIGCIIFLSFSIFCINHPSWADSLFLPVVNYGVGQWPFSVAIGDLNGDGKPDLAVANYSSNNVSVLIHTKTGCFIATAAFGSTLEGRIDVLRSFRNTCLLKTPIGKAFVTSYYKYSPPVADYISGHRWLRAIIRTPLLPVIGFVSLLV